MSEFLFRDPDETFAIAREQVAIARDNPEYQKHVLKQGPLYLEELNGASEELESIIERYGWPDEFDSIIKTPPRYYADADFIRGLKLQVGKGSLRTHPFLHMLGAPLIDSPDEVFSKGLRGIDFLGTTPSLHRAHAVAPDLIDASRVIVNTMMPRYNHYRIPTQEEFLESMEPSAWEGDEDPLLEGFLTPGNEDICWALHTSYQLMARLLKVDDLSRVGGNNGSKSRHTIAERALMGHE